MDEMQNLRIFTFYPVKILVLQLTVNILYELESKLIADIFIKTVLLPIYGFINNTTSW